MQKYTFSRRIRGSCARNVKGTIDSGPRFVEKRVAAFGHTNENDEKIPFKNIVCLSFIGSRITTRNRENKLMRQRLYGRIVSFQHVRLAVSPNVARCQSLPTFISKRKKKGERKRAPEKECMRLRQSCWLHGRETSSRGKHDRFYDLLMRLASFPS